MGGVICWNCGRPTGLEGRIMRSDCCPECEADQRCCRGCRFFDPNTRWQCREMIDIRISNKEKSNLCDYFQIRMAIKGQGGVFGRTDSKEDRRKKFDDLFND